MSVSQGAPLVRRIFGEHRRVLLPLLIALAANVVLYAAAVYPLSHGTGPRSSSLPRRAGSTARRWAR
jgi:hypothetical protein